MAGIFLPPRLFLPPDGFGAAGAFSIGGGSAGGAVLRCPSDAVDAERVRFLEMLLRYKNL